MGDGSPLPQSIENWIQLFDPAGVKIGEVTHERDAVLNIFLESDGTFLIFSSDVNGNETGNYGLSLQRVNR